MAAASASAFPAAVSSPAILDKSCNPPPTASKVANFASCSETAKFVLASPNCFVKAVRCSSVNVVSFKSCSSLEFNKFRWSSKLKLENSLSISNFSINFS